MQTALGQVRGAKGQSSARFVFDTAASRSFITRAKADEIGAKIVGEEQVSLGRFRENRRSTVKYKIVELEAVSHTGEKKLLRFAVSDVITTPIQMYPLDPDTRSKLRHVRLAEPLVAEAVLVTVDVLLGLDWYFDLIEEQQIRLKNGLVFMSSFFGYVGGGRSSVSKEKGAECNLFTFVTEGTVNNFELERFWSLEDLGIKDSVANNEDELALIKFQETLQFKDGRYHVRWPVKDGITDIPSNFGLAVGRLKSLLRRHRNDPAVIANYEKTFSDQQDAGIIEVAPEKPTGLEHYIPHQCVLKQDSNTTKFRVVMDASAKSAGQKRSIINECFYHCPLILTDLVGVILRMRLHKIGLVGDIEKAYLQIALQETERDCTRFLWVKDPTKPVANDNLIVYRFQRVPFGFGPSAFLLGGSVDDLLIKEGTKVAMDIRGDLFVDNSFGGRETVGEAVAFVLEAIRIFQKASMNLREWYSNNEDVVEALPEKQRGKGTVTKVLGLKWDTVSDTFTCPVGISADTVATTKRQMLKAMASVFDPCGYFTPVTVQAKILMQELWALKISWDDTAPTDLLSKWVTCSASLREIPMVPIDRQLKSSVRTEGVRVELHCFCDASTKAYAAAVYGRIESVVGTKTELLVSKSRVNPVKPLPVPRLELMSALVGSRLVQFVERELRVPIAAKVLWSDSKCTLHWIRGKQTYTRFMTITRRRNKDTPESLTMDGVALDEVNTLKLLGVSFDQKGSVKDHVFQKAGTAGKLVGMLRRQSKYLSERARYHIYVSCIRPVMEYCSPVFSNVPEGTLRLLDRIQLRACRLFPTLAKGLDNLETRREVAGLSQLHRIVHRTAPAIVVDNLRVEPLRVSRSSRSNESNMAALEVPTSRTDFHLNSFLPRYIRKWNNHEQGLLLTEDLSTFKRSVAARIRQSLDTG